MRIIDRRQVLLGGAGGAVLTLGAACAPVRDAAPAANPSLAALEAKTGGRLGVMILDTGSGRATGHRVGERFAMCSTFKLALAAIVLQRADRGALQLDQVLPYTKKDLLSVSPITTENLAKGGMTIEALAHATQTTSDNAAANVLIRHLGGPEQVTAWFRAMGDGVTRLDRIEPMMNDVPIGEIRDTTMPQAFARLTAKILTTNSLKPATREKLIDWMIETKTGSKRIRAGLPPLWRAGDKTGTGMGGNFNTKYNDVAIFWPPNRAPIVVAAYFEADGNYDDMRDQDLAVLAEVGRIAAAQAVEWAGGLD
jgi:beta-lactamase class A